MIELAAAISLAVLGTVAFACFTWGTLRHFVREGAGSTGAWAVSLLSLVSYLWFLFRVGVGALAELWWLSFALFVGSIILWAWALKRTRVAPPTLAFTRDTPRHLINDGPYRWIRHPFYTSYLVFWVGCALAIQGLLGWLSVAALTLIYWRAARLEEGKFAHSALAGRYRCYAMHTGMFLPRFIGGRMG